MICEVQVLVLLLSFIKSGGVIFFLTETVEISWEPESQKMHF